jgi:hypothetical protein
MKCMQVAPLVQHIVRILSGTRQPTAQNALELTRWSKKLPILKVSSYHVLLTSMHVDVFSLCKMDVSVTSFFNTICRCLVSTLIYTTKCFQIVC